MKWTEKRFYNRLNYSIGNEDWKTEQRALRIEEGDRCLCITASGDRPLHLLLDPCSEIVSIDANLFQNRLYELKAAALKDLDFETYLAFLGGGGLKVNRKELFHKHLNLDPDSRKFWEEQLPIIDKGILYQGFVEKLLRSYIKPLVHLFRKRQMNTLFSFEDLEAQKKFSEKEWNALFWRAAFKIGFNPLFRNFIISDPGFGEYASKRLDLASYFRERIHHGFSTGLAKESPLFSLVFQGKVYPEYYPPYLTKEGASKIREGLNKVQVKTENVIEYLKKCPENSFDVLSLSDVASYMDRAAFKKMLEGIKRAAKPGAKFCIRQFLTLHKIPDELSPHFERDQMLEKELEDADRCFIYRFFVGNIKK